LIYSDLYPEKYPYFDSYTYPRAEDINIQHANAIDVWKNAHHKCSASPGGTLFLNIEILLSDSLGIIN
jgi:hypothetical protein